VFHLLVTETVTPVETLQHLDDVDRDMQHVFASVPRMLQASKVKTLRTGDADLRF